MVFLLVIAPMAVVMVVAISLTMTTQGRFWWRRETGRVHLWVQLPLPSPGTRRGKVRRKREKNSTIHPMGSSQSNAHRATSNFQGAALWPGLRSGELAGFWKSHFIIFGFFARFPFLQKLNNKTIPFSSCSSNPPPRCEVFAQILKKQEQLGLPCHSTQ